MEENELIKEYQERKNIRQQTHNKEKAICPNCKKLKFPFFKGSDWCQNCYRKYLDRYCYYDYKGKKPSVNTKEYKICELLVKKNVKQQDIITIYKEEVGNTTINYVRNVVSKYLVKCDSLGNVKPNILKHK